MDLWQAATSRAKELVPIDLDAMAADDDYIHNDSLNVTKTTTTAVNVPAPSSNARVVNTDDNASWSLLDRMSSHGSNFSYLPEPPSTDNHSNRQDEANSGNTARIQQATDMLNAIVFDTTTTLQSSSIIYSNSNHQDTETTSTKETLSSHHYSRRTEKQQTSENEDDDDDASQDSFDEDDPIFSLMHQQTKTQKPKNSKHGDDQAKKNRFVQDLDERLASTVAPMDIESSVQPASVEHPEQPRRYWPWSNEQSSTHGSENGSRNTVGLGAPLWARPKKKKTTNINNNAAAEDFVTVSSGNIGFSDEERQALASLQVPTGTVAPSGIVKLLLQDHPRESFIVVTFILGAAVYFFSRITEADDFAR